MSIFSDYAHGCMDRDEFRSACAEMDREEKWYAEHGEETEDEIWCDNYACLYCVNDTCAREPSEEPIEVVANGAKKDIDCPLTWG